MRTTVSSCQCINAWIGWISDIIPLRVRARFFSAPSQYLMLTAVAVSYRLHLLTSMWAKPCFKHRLFP
jgi:hypothetical protein